MNCKPGDLAYVTAGAETPGLENRFVTVLRAAKAGEIFLAVDGRRIAVGGATGLSRAWVCAGSRPLPWLNDSGVIAWCSERVIRDDVLRPIRDPGDDAVDEVIQRLGKPANHKGKLVNAKPLKLETL